MLVEAGISKPDWKNIAKKLGFTLQGRSSSSTFFEEWCAFAHKCVPSWENLASALKKMRIYKAEFKKISEMAGMVMFSDIMHVKIHVKL